MAKPFEIDYIYVRSVRFGEKSSLENGVLTIELPKKEVTATAPVSHQIEIK